MSINFSKEYRFKELYNDEKTNRLEFDFAVLVAQLKSEFNGEIYKQTKHYKIERADVEEDIAYLTKKEADFWDQVQKRVRPPLILPEV